ncbi:MAG: chloride channel protein [Muribaculaceae bacterium]|nr:chloride channel protein [Muribaculaceae bacterium]
MSIYSRYIDPMIRRMSRDDGGWTNKRLTVHARVLLVCILTGILTGVGAWLLKLCIHWIGWAVTIPLSRCGYSWLLIVAPVVAIVVSGWLQRSVFHRYVNRGTERLRESLKTKDYRMPHQLTYQPIIGCAFTIGLGGSAGAEGPIAYAGAAIGSNAARFLRLDWPFVRLMVGMGSAAGIAAIFKAPLAGVFFALEVLAMNLNTVSILGIVTSCLVGASTAFLMDHCRPEIVWGNAITAFDYGQVLWLIPIGAIIGLYCRFYHSSGMLARSGCLAIKNGFLLNVAGGLFLGILIFLMPALFGEGYNALTNVLNGQVSRILDYSPLQGLSRAWVIPVMLAGIVLVKGACVFTTNNSGGVSGSFAPTLFVGGMAGMLLSIGAGAIGCHIPPTQMAYLCMAGAMAGIVRAPLMASFITVEVTLTYSLLLPVSIVAFISYWVAAGSSAWSRHKKYVPLS